MSYDIYIKGHIQLDRPLSIKQYEYLTAFAKTRRILWHENKIQYAPDPLREAVDLPIGKDGLYFTGGFDELGQETSNRVKDFNGHPIGPWCCWHPDESGTKIKPNEEGYNNDFEKWLQFIIDHFLKPWGYKTNGKIKWRGDDFEDIGTLTVKNNVITIKEKTL